MYKKTNRKLFKSAGVSLTVCSLVLLSLAGTVLPAGKVFAENENFDFSVRHSYKVKDSEIQVVHEYTVRNRTRAALESLEVALPVSQLGNLEVVYGDGGSISSSSLAKRSELAGIPFAHTSLLLDFPKGITGTNQTWNFRISYKTSERLFTTGNSHVLIAPFLDGRVGANWEVEVEVPGNWPPLNYSPPLKEVDVDSSTLLEFDGSDFDHPLLALSFSEDTTHEIEIRHQLRNRSLLPRRYAVVLPLDLHNQTMQLESINPKPTSINVDLDGNAIAYYRLWPFQSKTVTATATVEVRQLRYDPGDAKSISDTPEHLRNHTHSGRFWPTQSAVGERATQLIDPREDAWHNVRQILDFTMEEISFDAEAGNRIVADEVLSRGSGGAENIADLLLTMLRSQGVPARLIYGVTYPSLGLYEEVGSKHVWVEAYVAGVGWMHLDPVWSRLFGGVGSSSFDRVGMIAASSDDHLEFAGDDLYVSGVTASQTAVEKADLIDGVDISANRYVLVPGLTLDTTSAVNNNKKIVDTVEAWGHAHGTLPPTERSARWTWGIRDMSSQTVPISVDGSEGEVGITHHWWPAFVLAASVLVYTVIQFYRRRRRKYLRQRLNGKILH